MPAATLPILVNVFVAAMFVASFMTIAHLNPGFGQVRWFALSYASGMLTPLAEFVLPVSPYPEPFMVMSYMGVFLGILVMAPALSLLYERRPFWKSAGLIFVGGMALRALNWGGPRNEFWYELAYQIPFASAAALCAVTVFAHGYRRSGLDRAAGILFSVIAAHFLLKPFAAIYLGSGATAADYVHSTYALISQATSGLLLIAAGLLVLINVLQIVVLRDRIEATSDPLTGLPNRRALHRAFERLIGSNGKLPAAIAIVDIDHFKKINDQWGHGEGDHVIRGVARSLEASCPENATVARLGGEEFVVLIPGPLNEALARLAGENARIAVSRMSFTNAFRVTVSVGVTLVGHDEDLSTVLARADRALYRAKQNGRDRCVFDTPDVEHSARIPLRRVQ